MKQTQIVSKQGIPQTQNTSMYTHGKCYTVDCTFLEKTRMCIPKDALLRCTR